MIHPLALIGEPPEHREWAGVSFEPLIDETAKIGAFATVDAGLVEPTRIGARTWLMKHVHIGHDAQLGVDCELAPGVVIGGHVKVGNRVRFGVNACVRPFIEIGDGARIGAGAVVVKNVPAGEVWAGNPAKRLPEKVDAGWDEWWKASEQQKALHKEIAEHA